MSDLGDATVLLVGLGGLGCPAAWCLAAAGVGTLVLVDDDFVDRSNLHRQLLYEEDDVGEHKLRAAARTLSRAFPRVRIETRETRLLPDNARELVRGADLVVEGADNFATKFLAGDAARLERRPVAQGAAIRWVGTVLAVGPEGRPCYRCVFEDLPAAGAEQRCGEAGVMGPVTGLVGALLADRALRLLRGAAAAAGELVSYDGRADVLRSRAPVARADCPLCGDRPTIDDVHEARYLRPPSAVPCQKESPSS